MNDPHPHYRQRLTPHLTSPPSPAREITISVGRYESHLMLTYRLSGDLAALLLPERRERARADGLWRHTCFEAFVARVDSTEYVEYNFSPSDEWAAYQFSGYRADMRPHDWGKTPGFVTRIRADGFDLSSGVDIGWLGESRARLGVTAVIEDRAGGLSYWALKHPSEKPDFHHADSFIIEL